MLEISGLSPVKTRSRRQSIRSVVCAGGDFFSRLIVPIAFSAARMAVAEAAAAIRDREHLAPVRYRRSKQQEAAVATLMTFIHPNDTAMNLYPLLQTVVSRGRLAFGRTALTEALAFLHDLGIVRVWRDTSDGLATSKRRRVVVRENVQALIAGISERHLWAATKIVASIPLGRAFGSAGQLYEYLMSERSKWTPLPQAAVADFVVAQCAQLSVLSASRDARHDPAGELLSRRSTIIGVPVPGWRGEPDLTPYEKDQTPRPSTEGLWKEPLRPTRDCVAVDDFVQKEDLTHAVKCEQHHPVTTSRGNEMTNLTGRPILTKAEQAAQDRLRRQNAKAARATETTGRALGDMAPATGPSDTMIEVMRKDVAQRGLDAEAFDAFLQQMNAYGWRGKTQKQVDALVMKWFAERADGGAFKARQTPQKVSAMQDYRAIYDSLCGNHATEVWAKKVEDAGLDRYLEEAMTSSLLVAQEHMKTMDNPAWTGVKRIGAALGSSAYLWHIAGAEKIGEEVIIHVLHPMAAPDNPVMATQAHADVAARVVSAISGLSVKGVPSDRAWVRMGERELVHEKPF